MKPPVSRGVLKDAERILRLEGLEASNRALSIHAQGSCTALRDAAWSECMQASTEAHFLLCHISPNRREAWL